MKTILKIGWVILIDIVAIALLLFALLFGWLPGAPGIPIAIAGLALLALNHTWAEKLLLKVKAKLKNVLNKIKKNENKG